MFTNSMFGLLSPFLWISDVFYSNETLTYVFVIAVQLFYTCNCIFALTMMYAMHHFANYDKGEEAMDNSRLKEHNESVDNINFTMMFQRHNGSFESERGSKVGQQ